MTLLRDSAIRPQRRAAAPAYPDARVVLANPGVFLPRRRVWPRRVAIGFAVSGLIGGVVWTGKDMVNVPLPAPTVKNTRWDGLVSAGTPLPEPVACEWHMMPIVLDEFSKAGVDLPISHSTMLGFEPDAANADGTIAVEFEQYNGCDEPGLAKRLGPDCPAFGFLQPADPAQPRVAVGIFQPADPDHTTDAEMEADIRQQVRDFIRWLESQH
ncbi:MAG: hypothetical protein AB7S36_10115 [Planctomycetota bacterium]